MVRRRPRWGLITVVFALALIGWLNVRRSLSDVGWGRQLFLHEGRVLILKIEDAATMVVRALDGPASKYNGDFRIRLLGIERPKRGTSEEESKATEAFEISARFVRDCPGQVATVVFDRQRFDETETPLAYLFCGEIFLNAELLQSRKLGLVKYPGMPGKWMRELMKISTEPLATRVP